ncbi:MAG: histidine kinase N-terminal 7TM domain-containing protein [Butyrivibrio sp.]
MVFVIIAYICRIPGLFDEYARQLGILRSFIYIGLYMAWAYSVRSRIIQKQARRYLTAIALLMVFWFMVRTLKFHFISEEYYPDIRRYLWYLYYLPMIFIPVLSVFVAMSIGKPENYHLPKWTVFIYVPASVLFLLVITNDLHQLVFTFPKDAEVWLDSHNGYAIGYYLVVACMFISALMTLWVLCMKRRVSERRKLIILPCIPIIVLIVYMIVYYLQVRWLRLILGDSTAMMCLLVAASLEICIQCGFIQANTHYEELFSSASGIQAQITDDKYNVKYISRDATPIPEEQMRMAEDDPVLLPDGRRLHNMKIHGGHAVWTEDIKALLHIREKLWDTREELKERNDLLQYEYSREKEHKIVEEQNRLYDILQNKTQTQLDEISRLVSLYRKAAGKDEKKMILHKIVVLGSYIKRRKDLILSIDSTPTIPESKLTSAFRESFRALSMMGVKGAWLVHTGKEYLPGDILTLAYDFFEDTVEKSIDTLRSINVRVFRIMDKLRISILADGDGAFEELTKKYNSAVIVREEDEVCLVLLLEGGATT